MQRCARKLLLLRRQCWSFCAQCSSVLFALVTAGPADAATTRQNVYLAVAATTATPDRHAHPGDAGPPAAGAGRRRHRDPRPRRRRDPAERDQPGAQRRHHRARRRHLHAARQRLRHQRHRPRLHHPRRDRRDGGDRRRRHPRPRCASSIRASARGRPVVFERLIFRNGVVDHRRDRRRRHRAARPGDLRSCTFENNKGNRRRTGGGGIEVAVGSTAFFFDCTWSGNSAKNYGAGLALEENSTAYIHHSTFMNNRTNMPGHIPSVGRRRGIHNGNSVLRVTNSRFENNQAGYVGGGIYAIGTWTNPVSTPRADVLVVNTTFINNQARSAIPRSASSRRPKAAASTSRTRRPPASSARASSSTAPTPAAASTPTARSSTSATACSRATAPPAPAAAPASAAASRRSPPTASTSTANGTINRRPSQLTMRDTLFHGRAGSVTTLGQIRRLHLRRRRRHARLRRNGVPEWDDRANRAPVLLERVALVDCDVQQVAGQGSGTAAA